jgi:rRNA maturation RNase YbeY
MLEKLPRKSAKLTVSIHNRHAARVNKKHLTKIAKRVWMEEGVAAGRVAIILVDNEFIRDLNKTFLHENGPTDVIAFPIEQANGQPVEGEIYISLDQVAENSKSYAVDFNQELCRMVAHALLHFLGYGDHTRAGKMKMTERENYYLQRDLTI